MAYGKHFLPVALLDGLVEATRNSNTVQINVALRALDSRLRAIVIVSRYARQASDIPPLHQAACQALIRAAEKFDSSRGKPFEHLANRAIRNAILDELKAQSRATRNLDYFGETDTLDTWMSDHDGEQPSVLDEIVHHEARAEAQLHVGNWVKRRPVRQREFIRLHYEEGLSKSETARRMRITKPAVTKLNAAILRAGRHDLAWLEESLIYLN